MSGRILPVNIQQILNKALQIPVLLFLKEKPVKLPLLTPLPQLPEILSHKQQLLTRMSHHKCISDFQVFEFVLQFTWHLTEHGAFQMNHLIMRKHQHIFLTVSICNGKGHLVVIILAEIRIQLHIFQEIIHPSHVPFQGKSKTAILCFASYLRPCRRLFGDHHSPMISSKDNRIQVLKKFNRLQILIAAVLIGYPLTVTLAIIQIKHGRYCIHTQAVHMAFFDPEKCIGDQEVLYLRTSVIVDLSAPVRMLPLSWVFMLINCCTVKISQSMGILGEMSRNPVQDHTDLLSVKIIDHILKVLWRAISGSRCIIASNLIPP